MIFKNTELAGNIGFTSVIDEKFKTASLTVRFITKLDGDTAAENVLAACALTTSSEKYNTVALLNEKLSALYGASLVSTARKLGDTQILAVTASWIVNRYAIDGEDIEGEMLSLVRDCIFRPNVKDGAFEEESFKIVKKDLLDRIDGEINNKRAYALQRAAETAFGGEPAGFSCYGTKESAEKVTPGQAYEAYKRLLKTSKVEITYIIPGEDTAAEKIFSESFSSIDREPESISFVAKSPAKSEPVTVSDELDVRQCKMVMTFKSSSDDKYAVKLLSVILGETPVSKLFDNVREKMSLCYYCASRTDRYKGTLMIDSGVERKNIDKAREAILEQLDDIKKGRISDEELDSALLTLDNAFTMIGDTPSSYSSWFFTCKVEGEYLTPEEKFREYKNVTKARIVQAANSFELDSIYLMLSKEVQE